MTDDLRGSFDPERILRTLQRHAVRYVLIGGWAGKLLGSPTLTTDIGICYAKDEANLARLASALDELRPHRRGAPADPQFHRDVPTLRARDHISLATEAGSLDLFGSPAGVSSFEALERASSTLDLDGLVIRVAAIDDLIAIRRAAGRPKDLIELEVLGALREELDDSGRR